MTINNIVILPGDGVGPEVVREGVKILQAIADTFGHSFTFAEHLIGDPRKSVDKIKVSMVLKIVHIIKSCVDVFI